MLVNLFRISRNLCVGEANFRWLFCIKKGFDRWAIKNSDIKKGLYN